MAEGQVILKTEGGAILAHELGSGVPSADFMTEVADAVENWMVEHRTSSATAPREGRLVIEMSA